MDGEIASISTGQSRLFDSERLNFHSFKEYQEQIAHIDESKTTYIFFRATHSPNSGYSWCPQCVEAMEILEKRISALARFTLITVEVGSQEEWEAMSNPFRTDPNIQLRTVPTLIKYKTDEKLEGAYCLKPELLEQLLQDECEFYM